MDQQAIISAMRQLLDEHFHSPYLHAFAPQARLNADLYLDSVLVMQLLVQLELTLGIEIPDETLQQADLETVQSLAACLAAYCQQRHSADTANVDTPLLPLEHQAPSPQTQTAAPSSSEEFEDIKVHCVVSCLCHMLKADPRVDHRILYFGVWDAPIIIDEQQRLDYHAKDISHQFFIDWYQRLYGVKLQSWYQHHASKSENLARLEQLLAHHQRDQQLMVMLDMYQLPERENKFNQN